MAKFINPDIKQCQCIIKKFNPWTYGKSILEFRCKNKPTVIITEIKDKGSMSLCSKCLKIARKTLPKVSFKEKKI